MTTPKKSHRRISLRALLFAPAMALVWGCTDLTETPRDALTPDNAFRTEDEVLAGVASVYAGLRGTMWGWYNLNEVTTDEIIVPTRGTDWYDNGRWLEIHRQTWNANSGSALDDMNGTWNTLFSGVARANLMIEVVEKAGGASSAMTLAELRTLRAWYYYMLMDFFGGVPLVTTTEVAQNPRVSRDSVFKFIESELNAARTVLPETWPAANYGRVTRGAANAILASMYLNAQVFTGTVTPTGLTPGAARWQDAVAAADRVLNSGKYQLNPDFQANFSINNEGSPENIFVIVHTAAIPGLGMSVQMRGLHYRMLAPEPWNGFATLAETYRAFDPADKRRQVFLVGGPQRSYNTGEPVTDRQGNPLIFTDTIGNAEAAAENEGARLMKYPPMPGAPNGDSHPNDFALFRLAEMYLIKAEALNELGQTAEAVNLINTVRARSFSPPKPISVGTQAQVRAAILNERLFELAGEAKRRQDLIRHGRFTEARRFKSAQQPFKILFPIPQTQIQTNPLLQQNPGY